MHIHTVIISYKRKELTERTLNGYLETVSVPNSLIIVDNGSPPETTNWLSTLNVSVLYLEKNYFPGYAANRGWERMPDETTLLHRLDNDIKLLPGWCEDAILGFDNPKVGQYGLLADGDLEWLKKKGFYPNGLKGWPCGGNAIISRKMFDKGIRYSERPWTAGGVLEDTQLTMDIWNSGYQRVFSTRPVMDYMSGDIPDLDYDAEILGYRGLP